MKTLQRLSALALLALAGASVHGAEPRQNFWVELRWTESSVSGAAVAAVRDGAVVVGTSGSVSPRGATVLSTQPRQDEGPGLQRLTVLNGHKVSVQLGELVPVQWVDVYGVGAASGVQSGAGSNAGQGRAALRQGFVEQIRGFALELHWPGGQAPAQVQLEAQDRAPGGTPQQPAARRELRSTVLAPLGEWVTVARSGASLRVPERGSYSTRDAESAVTRELQLRVQLAP